VDRTLLLEYLIAAEKHIAEAERNLAHLRATLAKLESDGHRPAKAAELLREFEKALAMQIADRDRLRAELEDEADSADALRESRLHYKRRLHYSSSMMPLPK
jgi:hypothetical protein